jgi:hypothetical protein
MRTLAKGRGLLMRMFRKEMFRMNRNGFIGSGNAFGNNSKSLLLSSVKYFNSLK